MAREFPITANHSKLQERNLGSTRWGWIRSVWDSIHLVKPVYPQEFSNKSRPAWCMYVIAPWTWGFSRYPSASLWPYGGQDIAIEEVSFALYRRSTPVGFIEGPVIMYTPSASYVPFELDTVFWTPEVRPRQEFDWGNTLGVAGTNALVYGFAGWWGYSENNNPNASGTPRLVTVTFNPPLILEGYMFFTVQYGTTSVAADLHVNFRYREIG